MIARQSRGSLRHRGSQAGPPDPVTTDQPTDLRILLAVYESSRTGRSVPFADALAVKGHCAKQ